MSNNASPMSGSTVLESGRWRALAACNDPPTELETVSVLAFIVQAKKSLLKLRARMEPLLRAVSDTLADIRAFESDTMWRFENIARKSVLLRGRSTLLDQLFEQVVSLARDIHGGENISSASRRIPPEVLQQIFLFAAGDSPYPDPASTFDEDPNTYMSDSLSVRTLPWALTFVCRRWRGVATHCPTLWNRIHLDMHRYRHREIPKSLALNRFLRRSGTSMLSVTIYSTDDISEHPVLATILSSSDRWRKLWLHLPFTSFSAFSHIDYCLPELVSIAVHMTGDAPASGTPLTAFVTAPKLTDLVLRRVLFLHIPRKITHLSTTGSNEMISDLITQCHIENCRVRTSGGVLGHQVRSMARMKVLDVGCHSDSSTISVADFFDHVTLPCTTELDMHLGTVDDEENTFVIPNFKDDTVPQLRTLRVFAHKWHPEVQVANIVFMLQHTPHLTVLEIHIPLAQYVQMMKFILRYLTTRKPIALPKLRVLKVLPIDGDWDDWTNERRDKLLSLLEYRRSLADPHLTHVEVASSHSVKQGLTGDFATRLESVLQDKELTLV